MGDTYRIGPGRYRQLVTTIFIRYNGTITNFYGDAFHRFSRLRIRKVSAEGFGRCVGRGLLSDITRASRKHDQTTFKRPDQGASCKYPVEDLPPCGIFQGKIYVFAIKADIAFIAKEIKTVRFFELC